MILLIISSFLSILNVLISRHFNVIDRCVINRGIAFGISIEYTMLISVLLLILLVIVGYINKGRVKYILFSIFLLGLSNLITRFLLGGICDYISIPFLSINIADLGIVVLSIYAGIGVLGLKIKKYK